MGYYYMSFTDAELPEGSRFLGACIVEAADLPTAITKTHVLGINPGGDILVVDIPDPTTCPVPIAVVENRLLSVKELEKFMGPVRRIND